MEDFCIVPESRRYWVIRSERGVYLEHFLEHGFVAIGHLDDLNLKPTDRRPFETNWPTVRERLLARFESLGLKRRSAFAVVSQAKSFVDDIKEDDWVLVPGTSRIAVGRIVSPAFLDNETSYSRDEHGTELEMSFNLRRDVVWGPSLWRRELSSPLRRSLVANQTVFNVDEHWEAIYHALFPVFQRGEKLYFTAKLTSEAPVSNLDITAFLSLLSDIEVLSKGLQEGIDATNFDEYFRKYRERNELTLTTKAEFYSPGDIWVELLTQTIPAIKEFGWMPFAAMAYNMLFGNKKKGMDGVVDLKTRQRIWAILLDRIESRGAGIAMKNMGVDTPTKKVASLSAPQSGDE
ncbi:MAG: hypothetical protein EPN49_14805 [Rhodanobacter sp.]|nr:MAG: hypothetical protein EPN49_14805 [Rhodanobacter sp.]